MKDLEQRRSKQLRHYALRNSVEIGKKVKKCSRVGTTPQRTSENRQFSRPHAQDTSFPLPMQGGFLNNLGV